MIVRMPTKLLCLVQVSFHYELLLLIVIIVIIEIDYTLDSTPVSAMAIDGGQVCKDIDIIDDDSIEEATEYINITISADNDSIIIDDSTIIVTITDNDGI